MDRPVLPALRRPKFTASAAWLGLSLLFAAIAGVLFTYNAARYADETLSEVRLIPYLRYDTREDFAYFFSGAMLAWSGDAADLYPQPGEVTFYPRDPIFDDPHDDYTNARLVARGNYYNPPALAFLQAPLTQLSFRDAFHLFTALSLLSLMGFLFVAWRAGSRMAETPLLLLGVLAFRPVHEVVILGHTALFIILALTAGFLLARADRQVLAGLALSLLALKPQWAVLPALFLLVRGRWLALGVMGLAAAAIFFLPFAVTGLQTFENYVNFLRFSADIDLRDAPHMFSWNGFLGRLDGSEVQNGQIVYFADAPSKTLVYGLIGLTAAVLLVVYWSRDFLLGAAATVVAMLLVSTHSVWYDWSILVVAGLFLVMRAPRLTRGQRVELWVLMLAISIAASQSVAAIIGDDRHDITPLDWHTVEFFSLTPVAFAALVWMASVALREGLLRLPSSLLPLRLPPAAR